MEKLSVADTWFTRESETTFQHLVNVLVFDPEGPRLTMPRLRKLVEQRLHRLPLTRRRLVEVPLGLGEPYWIEDPEFDLDNHLEQVRLPRPGDDRRLAELAARLASEPLDRDRPLWKIVLVNGLESRRQAVIVLFHHASVDGGSGMDVTGILLDPTPEWEHVEPEDGWEPDRVPLPPELLARAGYHLARRPLEVLASQRATIRRLPKIATTFGKTLTAAPKTAPVVARSMMRRFREEGPVVEGPAPLAPRTPLNRRITANRSVAWETFSLDELKAIKNAFGVTLNDVVMAAAAGAYREWLDERDALPAIPTTVVVPVSVRTEEERGTFGNRVSIMLSRFPTNVADPVLRLRETHKALKAAKERHHALGPEFLTDWGKLTMPSLIARANRALSRTDLPVLLWNFAVTNVPGPRQDLYLAGRRLESIKPVGFIMDDLGALMAFLSYRDEITLAVIACPDVVPDVEGLVAAVRHNIEELAAHAAEDA
ncbi:MAG TPA: wax ester/triacylglycerol synthase family O-acyltransferase [Solirubrobacter sp.]|nr:wax ester/triacylglycerol synthase family O-acyltransferase [Solirubrobacter sp.]